VARILAISPHLDDAALSYGGRLAEAGAAGDEVIVYTVFAGSPREAPSEVAAYFHRSWK
jgi:LmbE family N-acetylglucosaminyl deacetylase